MNNSVIFLYFYKNIRMIMFNSYGFDFEERPSRTDDMPKENEVRDLLSAIFLLSVNQLAQFM